MPEEEVELLGHHQVDPQDEIQSHQNKINLFEDEVEVLRMKQAGQQTSQTHEVNRSTTSSAPKNPLDKMFIDPPI